MKVAARILPTLTLAALLAACSDQPTSPPGTPARPPSVAIHDGAHGGGNPGFFFLPPLVPSPSGNAEFGDAAFATVSPVVTICQLNGDPAAGPVACQATVASFSGSQIAVSVADRQYSVNWDTKATDLNTSAFYRLSVYVGNQMLGFADVDPVTSQELRNAKSGEVITLLDGRTLPIKFTVEDDGICGGDGECTIVRVSNSGGSFTLPSGHGGLYLPEGWLPPELTEVSLTLQRIATGADNYCLEEGFTGPGLVRQYEGCMEITTEPELGPYGGIQTEGAVVGLCLEIPSTDPDYDYLQIFKSDAGRPIQGLAEANPKVITGFGCTNFTGTPVPDMIGSLPAPLRYLASAAVRGTRSLARLVQVQPLYAIDLGEGGSLLVGSDFSHFVWGLQGTMEPVGATTVATSVNQPVVLATRVLTHHVHEDTSTATIDTSTTTLQGIPVTFTLVSELGGGFGNVEGTTTGPVTVSTNELGIAQVEFITPTAGVHTIVATANTLGAPVTFTVNAGITVIDFETWPIATDSPCDPACALTTEYSPHAQFSFIPDGDNATIGPALRVLGGPYYSSTNHSASVPVLTGGYAVGTLRMALGGNPTRTTFQLRYGPGPDPGPQVTAYAYDPSNGAAVPVPDSVSFTLTSTSAFREANVTVNVSTGIYRIDVAGGTTSDTFFLDNVNITGATFPLIE